MLYLVLGLLAVAGATAAAPRLGVAAPLLLVVLGAVVGWLPFAPAVHVEPGWVLTGVLPPLLYSAAASMPATDFRREFTAIRGLSVVLVLLSSLALGGFFALALPDLGLAWGIALGAIVSPTDAVATTIVKRLGVAPRVVTMLEGEGLLNDATALVVLRTAVAGAAASISLWSTVGRFALSVVVAVALGGLVGKLALLVRARVTDATVSTVLSFSTPFLAAVPAEELGASGLLAAVVAGLITGAGALRALPPQHRLSDESNWRTAALVLEGGVFLVLGLQLAGLVDDVRTDAQGLGTAAAVAAGALALTVVVRAVYVALLVVGLGRRTRHGERMRSQLTSMQERIDTTGSPYEGRRERRRRSPRDVARMRDRIRRGLGDIDHFLAHPVGWRDGVVVAWSGMRGAVTLAAAQTLPEGTPDRSLLVLVAFGVAAGSLLLQGGSLPWVVRRLGAVRLDEHGPDDERRRLLELMTDAAATVPDATPVVRVGAADHPKPDRAVLQATKEHRLAVIAAQRTALLDARDGGAFSSEALGGVLAVLDADQIGLELRGAPAG